MSAAALLVLFGDTGVAYLEAFSKFFNGKDDRMELRANIRGGELDRIRAVAAC